MSGVNKVILIGNLGKDPEIRHIEGGIMVAKFPLATSEVYKNKEGQKITQTEWHNVVLWRGLAETADRFLKKGSLVYVEGQLRSRSWDDKDGNKRYITEIIGNSLTLLGRKSDENGGGAPSGSPAEKPIQDQGSIPSESINDITDDLPF